MSATVEVVLTYTGEDFAITSRHIARKRPRKFGAFAPICIVAVLAVLANILVNPLTNLEALMQPRSLFILALIAALAALYFIMKRRKYGFWAKSYFQDQINSSKSLGAVTTFRFSEKGVRAEDRFSTTEIRWEYYSEIEETDDYLYFYTSKSAAQIFPKRAFSDDDLKLLRLILKSYVPAGQTLELFA